MNHPARALLAYLPGTLAASLCAGGLTCVVPPAVARAAPCGTAITAGTNCLAAGALTVSAGSLNLTSPGGLSWGATLNGKNQHVPDTTPADETFQVTDATGSGRGWHVTVSATQLTNGASKLPNTGTLTMTGSVSSASATTAPIASCATGVTCTLPGNTTTYPVAITTAASAPVPVTIYTAIVNKGLGTIKIGATGGPVGWWLALPSNAVVGTYISTITFELISGPS